MSPAGLYHYFPNKAAIALFPLAHGNGLCVTWDAMVARLPDDPAARLQALVAFAAEHAAEWRLSIALSRQMTQTPALQRYADRLMAEALRDFATIARTVERGCPIDGSATLYEMFTAIIVADLPGFDRSAEAGPPPTELMPSPAGWRPRRPTRSRRARSGRWCRGGRSRRLRGSR
jgi:AcrR family transcriptional regulator